MSRAEARVAELEALLGREAVAADGAGHVTVTPTRVSAVSELMRWAAGAGAVLRTPPARPLGGRRAFPGADEILLRLEGLRATPRLNLQAGTVDVAGGTSGADLAYWLHREGRWVQPRPAPFYREPLGAYLAGPGLAAEWIAFSMWESPLMSLEAVLLDGRVLRVGVAPRSAAGPDYRAFLVGVRDRVGVITGATWRTAARAVPMLFAARFPDRGEALALLRDSARRGWRPWSSRVVSGKDPGRWSTPSARREKAAVALLCYRAAGGRAALIRRQLRDATRAGGGEVLEAADARAWYEGSMLAVCRQGPAAVEELGGAPGKGTLATAWLAVPWAGLPAAWDALLAGKGARSTARVLGEGFRAEGGLLQVQLGRKGKARTSASAAVSWAWKVAGEHGGRLAALQDGAGRPVAPAQGGADADELMADVVRRLGPAVLNPAGKGGR